MRHGEFHNIHRVGWLRAAVLGANDGIISTASLMMGMVGAQVAGPTVLLTGLAGLVAGALSMAAGEYVSVRSQADTEDADMARERAELAAHPESELHELTEIYVARGLDRSLARQVAIQLTAHDALAAHARDELGIVEALQARPLQAAIASAATFALGALIPIATALLAKGSLMVALAAVSLASLAGLGALAAKAGGASLMQGAVRVCSWGAIAMAATGAVGYCFGIS
jgi:vacuolar iron transporter family protein